MPRALLLLLLLGACAAELPPIEGTISQAARAAPEPQLIPVGPILAQRDVPVRARAAELELDARAAGLRREAGALSPPAGPSLEAEGEALRRRAEELRNAPL
ncbi:hypothetical protein [Jannaschia formosa]|uniref:hypothetical protein n=1 Tax=Jannaschia formosa TaxID=2259592 RepID=UPI0010752263|nr:hypothetical protein [Jannaschia formosa]TFL17028.1 hypothetical protein DR046_16580 [Jannaschia formosa]